MTTNDDGTSPHGGLALSRSTAVGRAFLLALLAAWAVDVATKLYAAARLDDRAVSLLGGRLLLRESRNTGAAFSIGTGSTVLITLVGVAVVTGIAVYVRRASSSLLAVGLGLVAGGALGNLTDRFLRDPGVLRGGVVDWIDLGWFPSFNAADTAITIGAGLVLLSSLREDRPPAGDG